jgi:ABC-type Zn uptake system ZnuABC Zn-binding protein ZnuA
MNSISIFLLLLTNLFIVSELHGQDKLLVVTSASIFADMIKNVGGDLVDVKSIIPIGTDPHSYEPKASDINLMANADLVMLNGLDLEIWMSKVIRNIKINQKKVVILTKGLQSLKSEDYANSYDPHAWMTASNGLVYIQNIKDALADKILDENDKSVLLKNYDIYRQSLEQLNIYSIKRIKEISANNRKLVTAHDAFQYFGREYGLQLHALQGVSPEADIRINDFQNIIKLIRANQIPAIFVESTINPKVLENLAKEASCEIGGKLYADSLSDKNGGAPDYYSLLKSNIDTIVDALTKKFSQIKTPSKSNENIILYSIVFSIMVGSLLFLTLKI